MINYSYYTHKLCPQRCQRRIEFHELLLEHLLQYSSLLPVRIPFNCIV